MFDEDTVLLTTLYKGLKEEVFDEDTVLLTTLYKGLKEEVFDEDTVLLTALYKGLKEEVFDEDTVTVVCYTTTILDLPSIALILKDQQHGGYLKATEFTNFLNAVRSLPVLLTTSRIGY